MLTKNDMSRVIVQALYNLDELPKRDNVNVLRFTKQRKDTLQDSHKQAMDILNAKVKASMN